MEGIEVRGIREAAGMTQKELAVHIGLGARGDKTVRRWESGETRVPGPVAFALRAMDNGFDPKDPKTRDRIRRRVRKFEKEASHAPA